MNRRLLVVTSLALAVAASATQGGKISLTTIQGTWELSQLSSWNFKYPPKSNHAHFIFKGKPVRAALNKNERVLTALEVEGDARLEGKTLIPERIDFRGGITGHDSKGARVTDISADSAVLTGTATENDLVLLGNVRFTNKDTEKGSSLTGTGTKGTITGQAKGGAVGTLQGPVHVTVAGTTKDGSPVNLDATCNEMNFDLREAPFKIVMRGNVTVKGAQPGYEGETRATKLTVLLDKDYQPIEMQGSGDPGVTTLQKGGNRR